MKRIHQLIVCAFVLAAIVACWPSTASAAGPFGGDCWNYFGINGAYGLYGNRVNEVPYFSMFPPVYYSQPVARSYGWSPFAYPPGVMTPDAPVPQPQEIINPHVPQRSQTKPSSATTPARTTGYRAPEPKEIINPFVNST